MLRFIILEDRWVRVDLIATLKNEGDYCRVTLMDGAAINVYDRTAEYLVEAIVHGLDINNDYKNIIYTADLDKKLVDEDLPVRVHNVLFCNHIRTFGDLIKYKERQLLRFPNFGRKSLNEIKRLLKSKNLELRKIYEPDLLEWSKTKKRYVEI
jgi:hypothetical protein